MYLNNKKLYQDISEWQGRRDINPDALMGEYTAECILLVAHNLVKRYNFANYTWREDMIGDGVECCVKYLKNYKLEYTNPHAYITQICFTAFVNRIKKENHQNRIKYKVYVSDVADIEEFDDNGNQIHIDYSFYKDIGEKLKDEPAPPAKYEFSGPPRAIGLERFL